MSICPIFFEKGTELKRINVLIFILFPILCFGISNKYPLDTDYYTTQKINKLIVSCKENSSFEVRTIGYSTNDKLPIYAIKWKATKRNVPTVLLIGQIHGEEPLGVEIVMDILQTLLKKGTASNSISKISTQYNIWFIPTLNPEGFQIVNSGKYALQRKNKTDTNRNGRFDYGIDGVDINKNFPLNWNNQALAKPSSPYYRGRKPSSEKETQALIRFFKTESILLSFCYHSSYNGAYNERIYFPWIHKGDVSADFKDMKFFAKLLASNLPRDYRKGNYTANEISTSEYGFARDYLYAKFGTYSYDIEVGGINQNGTSIVFPPNSMRSIIVNKHKNAMIKMLTKALDYLWVGEFNRSNIKVSFHQSIPPNVLVDREGFVFRIFSDPEKQHSLFINGRRYNIAPKKRSPWIQEFPLHND